MIKLRQYRRAGIFAFSFFLLIFLHSFHYLDITSYDLKIGGWIDQILCLLLIVFINLKVVSIRNTYSSNYVLAFLFVPMLSIIPCSLERGQPVFDSLHAFLFYTVIFIYFYLFKYGFKAEPIIRFILFIAIIRILIIVIQQFTYPHYLFVGLGRIVIGELSNEVEIRSGIYRYLLSDTFLTMILIFYSWQKLLENITYKRIILLCIGLIGLYLDQSRQFIASTIGVLLISPFLANKEKNRIYSVLFVLVFIFLIYLNFSTLFSDLSEKTTELDNDYIRFLSVDFYLNKYWSGPFTVLFGNGLPAYDSVYANEIANNEINGMYRVDIGIVGGLNQYGIATILTFLLYYFSVIRKHWSKIDLYLRMFLISVFFNLVFIFPLIMPPFYWIFWGVLMFLIDKSISKTINLS